MERTAAVAVSAFDTPVRFYFQLLIMLPRQMVPCFRKVIIFIDVEYLDGIIDNAFWVFEVPADKDKPLIDTTISEGMMYLCGK